MTTSQQQQQQLSAVSLTVAGRDPMRQQKAGPVRAATILEGCVAIIPDEFAALTEGVSW